MRICLVYDCLFPYTVGGAERWYRNLAERLAAAGHEVTYLTLRQWERGEQPELKGGVRVVSVGPRMELYGPGGERRILPPLVFGLGVFLHLARRHGGYDAVHTCAFPYFSLLAAALLRPLGSYELVVDWFEVWSRDYWRQYLGRAKGAVGAAVQRLCVRVRQHAFCFSQLHARRLREEGLRGTPTLLRGLYAGPVTAHAPQRSAALVVFAGRMIREKRAPAGVAGVALAGERIAGLRGAFYGDGPERGAVLAAISRADSNGRITAPGFVAEQELADAMRSAMCVLLPSAREGFGMVVVEAAAVGVPSIVVAGEDNAATELIEEGVNGTVAASAEPRAIADAIVAVHEAGQALRERTARWFSENAVRLSLESSLETVLASYARPSARS
jgi:glycosyltransferase involved in cell wall biosynthesis